MFDREYPSRSLAVASPEKLRNLIAEHIRPVAIALAKDIDEHLCELYQKAYEDVPRGTKEA